MLKGLYRHEKYALGILVATILLLSLRLPFHSSLGPLWLGHLCLLLAYLALLSILESLPPTRVFFGLRGLLTVMGVIGTLFITLGWVGFECVPWRGDPWLDWADRLICLGSSPSLWLESLVSYRSLEFFSLIYGVFIPYMYLSVFLSAFGRPRPENESFLAGFVLLYAIGYLGYLLVPATGPRDYLASQFNQVFAGGPQYARMMDGVRLTGPDHGAFPSLHVGASVYLGLFELRHNRLRGMTFLPLALLIIFSTLFLRWHYLVDVIAGALLAILLCPIPSAGTARHDESEADPMLQFLQRGDREPLPVDWTAPTTDLAGNLAALRHSKKAPDLKRLAGAEAFLSRLRKTGIMPADLYLPLDPGKAAFFALREMEIAVMGLPWACLGLLGIWPFPSYAGAYFKRTRTMMFRARSFFCLWRDPGLRSELQDEGRKWLANFNKLRG